jgi:hypothetical protein
MPGDFSVYKRLPGIVLGFHGCDEKVGEDLLRGATRHLSASSNDYDWLGSGIYFWENDPQRALEFAKQAVDNPLLTKGKIEKPFVVGAVIDLGLCLNLLDRSSLQELASAYDLFKMVTEVKRAPMPQNRGADLGARFLDRAVIEFLHKTRERLNLRPQSRGKYPSYETVRGAFWEGGELYPTSGFGRKNHIQIAVRAPHCIKGYFRPIDS